MREGIVSHVLVLDSIFQILCRISRSLAKNGLGQITRHLLRMIVLVQCQLFLAAALIFEVEQDLPIILFVSLLQFLNLLFDVIQLVALR